MTRPSSIWRWLGIILLLSSVLFLLTGCFNVRQEIWMGSTFEEGKIKVILSTPSEEVFEMLKGNVDEDEDLDEEDVTFEVVEPESPEGSRLYKMIVETSLAEASSEEDIVNVFPYEEGTAYEIALISGDDEEDVGAGEEEPDEMTKLLFKDYHYHMVFHFLEPVTGGWWGKFNSATKPTIPDEAIWGKTVDLKLPLLEAFSKPGYITVVTGTEPTKIVEPPTEEETDGAKSGGRKGGPKK